MYNGVIALRGIIPILLCLLEAVVSTIRECENCVSWYIPKGVFGAARIANSYHWFYHRYTFRREFAEHRITFAILLHVNADVEDGLGGDMVVGFPEYVHIKQSVHGGRIYEATFIITSFRLTLNDRRPRRSPDSDHLGAT